MLEIFLTIIVPVYKIKEKYLRECLDSLLEQESRNFKVIIVDDGSPDNCGEICEEYTVNDSRFKVLHQENLGVSEARNNALRMVDTEWVTFVDPDDWVEKDYVLTLYHAVKRISADIFLFDYYQEFATKTKKKSLMKYSQKFSDEWVDKFRMGLFNYLKINGKYYEYEINTIWDKMYRTSFIKNNNLLFDPDARKGQDAIFNSECFQCSDQIFYIHKALYHYRYLQESVTNRFNTKVQYYNEIAFKHYERIIKKFNLPEKYRDAYYARVSTRLYSCMRLFYFHSENQMSKEDVIVTLDATLNSYPYNIALQNVKYKNLTVTQKIFVFCVKKRAYTMLRILVNGRQTLKELGGFKLKGN